MKLYSSEVLASPSNKTDLGKKLLKQDREHRDTLGIATSEAVEDDLKNDDTAYPVGRVLYYVLMHQTVIGLEVVKQLEMLDVVLNVMIRCLGGGSNLGGFACP